MNFIMPRRIQLHHNPRISVSFTEDAVALLRCGSGKKARWAKFEKVAAKTTVHLYATAAPLQSSRPLPMPFRSTS